MSTCASGTKADFAAMFKLVATHYLPTLVASASLHLFVLPPSRSAGRTIDHAILLNSLLSRDNVFGVELQKINDVLGHYWLSSISDGAGLQAGKNSHLAEYRTSWPLSEGSLFARYTFSPMRVQALCEKEVILYIKANVCLFFDQQET
jgi:hypothetical protein